MSTAFFLLDKIADFLKEDGKCVRDFKSRVCIHMRHRAEEHKDRSSMEWLASVLRATTLKIVATEKVALSNLRDYANSFAFQYMYKRGTAIAEYVDFQDMYSLGNSAVRFAREQIDSPPQRIYNKDILDYYRLALEGRDPFTQYISFYHIIEYYFDAVFNKKLAEDIRSKITHPSFSYKSDEKLNELARYIRRRIKNDDASGKGNERDALKYVLMKYVPIQELKSAILSINPNAVRYYQDTVVPFAPENETKIAWSDTQGVYAHIANRIYETRNALVHSKSDQSANLYRPYTHKKDLALEMALIKAVADLVIINSSEVV